jgi:hypothetical protein
MGSQGFTFVEQMVLNLVGPLLTALVVGIGFAEFARRAQNRQLEAIHASDALRADSALEVERQRADEAMEVERHRENHLLRERLIGQAIEAPSALYLATQHYWRAKEDGLALVPYREALDATYLKSRRQGLVLEHLLRLHFADPLPRRLIHRAMDLLTIRYFQLVRDGGASPRLRRKNEGDDHTGLSKEDLDSPPKVLAKYHTTIDELVDAIAGGALDRLRSEGTPAGRSAEAEHG